MSSQKYFLGSSELKVSRKYLPRKPRAPVIIILFPENSFSYNYGATITIDKCHFQGKLSGYNSGDKVWYSSDKGQNWNNISGSLPNLPVNCIVVDPDRTDHSVYVGTDAGVFYRDDNLSDWVPYFHGLPNTVVEDLEIENGKLIAGTHGRGVWKTNLYGNCFSTLTLGPIGNPSWSSSYSNLPQYYAASDWVVSERTIYNSIGDSVRYQGGNYISLLPGFSTQAGANFKARIAQCDPTVSPTSGPNSSLLMSPQDAIIYRSPGSFVQ